MHNTVDPDDLAGQEQANNPKGHDLRALGPSDSSDTGADMVGPGLLDDEQIGLDRGTNEDSEAGHLDGVEAGASLGDRWLEDNSDRYGTGEHVTAGKDPDVRVGNDIAPDRIVGLAEAGLGGGLDEAEEALARTSDEDVGQRQR